MHRDSSPAALVALHCVRLSSIRARHWASTKHNGRGLWHPELPHSLGPQPGSVQGTRAGPWHDSGFSLVAVGRCRGSTRSTHIHRSLNGQSTKKLLQPNPVLQNGGVDPVAGFWPGCQGRQVQLVSTENRATAARRSTPWEISHSWVPSRRPLSLHPSPRPRSLNPVSVCFAFTLIPSPKVQSTSGSVSRRTGRDISNH
jgi:hypothetical protein